MIQKKMMKLAYFLIMGLVIGCSHHNSQKMTKTDDKLNLSIHKYVLDNGLRVLIHENKKLPILSYYTFFDVGGRYEEEGTTGATHFLEHMMFKGAKKYGPGALYSYIESNGGSINAYTSFDDTVYYQTAPSHALEKIIDIESDRLQHLLLDPALFKKEKQIILEERKMRYENSDRGKLYQQMMKEVFKGTPYGGSVIGEKKDVINLKRDQMMDFFKRFYTPDNAIIVISGDVNAENAIRMIKKKYGHIKRSQDLEETV